MGFVLGFCVLGGMYFYPISYIPSILHDDKEQQPNYYYYYYILSLIKQRTFQNTNLVHNSFNIQQYICYMTLLNIFRAARCSSSGEPIASGIVTLCKQPYSILYGCIQRVTIPEAVVIQLVLLMISSVLLETC